MSNFDAQLLAAFSEQAPATAVIPQMVGLPNSPTAVAAAPATVEPLMDPIEVAPQSQPQAAAPVASADMNAILASLAQAQSTNATQQTEILRQLAESRATPAAPPAPPPAFDVSGLLSPADVEAYGGVLPVLTRVAHAQNAYIQQHTVGPLQAQLAALQQRLDNEVGSATQVAQTAMNGSLRAAIPGLAEVAHTPEWRSYVETTIPGTPYKVRDVLTQAHSQADWTTIGHHVKAVKDRMTTSASAVRPVVPPAGAPARTAPATGAQRSASANAAAVPPQRFANLADHARAGSITPDGYQNQMDAFLAALFTADPGNSAVTH